MISRESTSIMSVPGSAGADAPDGAATAAAGVAWDGADSGLSAGLGLTRSMAWARRGPLLTSGFAPVGLEPGRARERAAREAALTHGAARPARGEERVEEARDQPLR